MKIGQTKAACVAMILGATLLAGSGLAQSKGRQETLTGNIADYMCGPKHTMMKNTDDKKCTLECVKMGSPYSLVVGGKVYELAGKEKDLEKFAGTKAKVTGSVKGMTITVTSVAGA